MRHSRLIASATCLGVLLAASLSGCAAPVADMNGVCRNTAIYCAQLLDEITQCEVVCGTTVDHINHCQARCILGGQVKWVSWQDGYCTTGKEEHPFVPSLYRVMSVVEAEQYLSGYFPSINRNIGAATQSSQASPGM